MPIPETVADFVPLDLSVIGTTLSPLEVDRKLRDARNQIYNGFNRLAEVYLATPEELRDPRLMGAMRPPYEYLGQLDEIMWEMHLLHGNH